MTLVDAFTNFLLGIEFYDKFRYRLVDERDLRSRRIEELKKMGKYTGAVGEE